METMKELIRPELLVLIPVLYFTGMGLKKSVSVLDKHIPLLCAGWDGCGAARTGRPKRPLSHPTGLSRSRYTTGSCCTSGWPGSRHISMHTSLGIADTPCPV